MRSAVGVTQKEMLDINLRAYKWYDSLLVQNKTTFNERITTTFNSSTFSTVAVAMKWQNYFVMSANLGLSHGFDTEFLRMAIEGASSHVFLVAPEGGAFSSLTLDTDKQDDAIIQVQPLSLTGQPLTVAVQSAKLNILNNAYYKKGQFEMVSLVNIVKGLVTIDIRPIFTKIELGSYVIMFELVT